MYWKDLPKWNKNYIAICIAIWALTIAVGMGLYSGSGTDLPSGPFVLGFIVILISMFVYVPINIIFTLRDLKVKKAKISSAYVYKKIFWMAIDLIVIYYFFHLFFTSFFTNKDAFLGLL